MLMLYLVLGVVGWWFEFRFPIAALIRQEPVLLYNTISYLVIIVVDS